MLTSGLGIARCRTDLREIIVPPANWKDYCTSRVEKTATEGTPQPSPPGLPAASLASPSPPTVSTPCDTATSIAIHETSQPPVPPPPRLMVPNANTNANEISRVMIEMHESRRDGLISPAHLQGGRHIPGFARSHASSNPALEGAQNETTAAMALSNMLSFHRANMGIGMHCPELRTPTLKPRVGTGSGYMLSAPHNLQSPEKNSAGTTTIEVSRKRQRESAKGGIHASKKGRNSSGCLAYCARSGYCSRCTRRSISICPPSAAALGALAPKFPHLSIAPPVRATVLSNLPNALARPGTDETTRLLEARETWLQLLSQIPAVLPCKGEAWLPAYELFYRATGQGILEETALNLRQWYAVCSAERACGGGRAECNKFLAMLRSVGSSFTNSVESSCIMPQSHDANSRQPFVPPTAPSPCTRVSSTQKFVAPGQHPHMQDVSPHGMPHSDATDQLLSAQTPLWPFPQILSFPGNLPDPTLRTAWLPSQAAGGQNHAVASPHWSLPPCHYHPHRSTSAMRPYAHPGASMTTVQWTPLSAPNRLVNG